MFKRKEKYVPNLLKLQTVCARNYGLFLRLLPLEYQEKQSWQIAIKSDLVFDLEVTQVSKFTEEFKLKLTPENLPAYMATEIDFRVYHDAQMIEVTGYQKQKQIRQKYNYPNSKLYQKDEKLQINLLLKDWLNMTMETQKLKSGASLISQIN